jgi:tripartite-type tricarboxylate transporter receptor subunit TctC
MTTQVTRRTALVGAGAMLTAAASGPSFAQGKPVKFILPNAPASGVDTITRTIQNELSKHLGAPIVIENQPGAGGVVGTQQMVRSAPDGTTLSIVSNNHVIYPSVLKSVPFDPIADITPIAVLGSTPIVLVANPAKVPAKTVQELTAMLKAAPEKHTYASSGNGTILHLAAAMYVEQAGLKVTHVPYRGVGPMVTDLISGQVDFGTLAWPSAAQHVKSGALRAIGFGTEKRVPAAPEIPTFVEQGMPNYVVEAWFGCIGPAKIPEAEVRRINDALVKTFAAPEIKAAMAAQANTIDVKSPAEAAAHFKSELAKYAAVVKAIKLEPQ